MLVGLVPLAIALVGLVPGAAPGAVDTSTDAPRIDHAPLTCVVAGRYPRIEARVTTAASVSTVRARFRLVDSDEWYSVRLSSDGDRWSGALPRPTARLGTFLYHLEATDEAASTVRTDDAVVRVVSDEDGCGAEGAGPSVSDASPLVDAPPGAPPLPEGFADHGDDEPTVTGVGKGGVFNLGPTVSVLAGLGVTAAAVAVGLKGGGASQPAAPTVTFVGSDPGVGSEISLSTFHLSLRFRVVSDADVPSGSVAVSLRPAGRPLSCLDMWVPHTGLSAGRVNVVTVDRILFVNCEAPFSIDEVRAVVRGPQERDLFGGTFVVSYRVVP